VLSSPVHPLTSAVDLDQMSKHLNCIMESWTAGCQYTIHACTQARTWSPMTCKNLSTSPVQPVRPRHVQRQKSVEYHSLLLSGQGSKQANSTKNCDVVEEMPCIAFSIYCIAPKMVVCISCTLHANTSSQCMQPALPSSKWNSNSNNNSADMSAHIASNTAANAGPNQIQICPILQSVA